MITRARNTSTKSDMRSFKSNENIHKKEGGSYYVVSANKAPSATPQSPGNGSQRKHTATPRTRSYMTTKYQDGAAGSHGFGKPDQDGASGSHG